MKDFTIIRNGPWRVRDSGMEDERTVVSWFAPDGSGSEVALSETLEDLVLLRDAIDQYLAERAREGS